MLTPATTRSNRRPGTNGLRWLRRSSVHLACACLGVLTIVSMTAGPPVAVASSPNHSPDATAPASAPVATDATVGSAPPTVSSSPTSDPIAEPPTTTTAPQDTAGTVDTEQPPSDESAAEPNQEVTSGPLDGLTVEQVDRLRAAVAACGVEPGRVCRWVLSGTDDEALAELAQWFVDVPVRLAAVLVVAVVLNRMVRAVIHRWLVRLNQRSVSSSPDDPAKPARSTRRMATASSTLASAAAVAIYATAGLVLLGEFGISLGPLLAGAGVVGLAIGFGAQHLVRDLLAGLFVLIEDQYGVGDVIDAGRAAGEVEDFSLRMTKIRDLEGTLWFVPNGLVAEVGNKSQIWSRAVLDVEVAYETDLDHAGSVIKAAADRVWREQSSAGVVIEEPALWGVERLGDSGIAIRLAVKCAPAEQWAVARTLRAEIKRDLDAAGIEIPFPQQALWLRSPSEAASTGP